MTVEVRKGDALVPHQPGVLLPTTRRQHVYARYATSTRVPVVLKTRSMAPDAPQARRNAVRVTARSVFRTMPGALVRGAVHLVRTWWRWTWCMEERAQAREEGKLHQHADKLRQEAKYRWVGAGICTILCTIAWFILGWLAPAWVQPLLLVLLGVGLVVLGHPRGGELAAGVHRGARWLVDASHFAEGLREAKLLGKDLSLRVVSPPVSDNGGWSMVVDLPGALKASSVIAKREDLAAAFDVDEESLVLERDRSAKGHASRLSVWACPHNPFFRPSVRFPLMDVERASVWSAQPFGIDARGRVVELSLMWSSMLVGARPRRGKTAACRVAAAPFVLDPTVSIRCFDGKGGRDWIATRPICDQYVVGADDEAVVELLTALGELHREIERRYARLRGMPDEQAPDNKLTEEISAEPANDMPVTLVIIDELQNFTTAGRSTAARGEVPIGEKIAEELIWLAKNASAVGVVLMLITQRPSSESLPTELRSQIGTRFGLKVDTWQSSNMILGDLNTQGYDCSKLLGTPGVGILVPDGELAALDMGMPTLRTYYVDAAEWRVICERGARLRGIDPAAWALRPSLADEQVLDAEVVHRWIDDAVDAFEGRAFVPSAELGSRLDLSPTALAERMLKWGIRPSRTSSARGYKLADVRAAAESLTEGVTGA